MMPHQQRTAQKEPRFRQVLDARKQGLSLEAVGKLLGLSRERVRQLEIEALIHFKKPLPAKVIRAPSKATLLKRELATARQQVRHLCTRLAALEGDAERANKAASDFRLQMQDAGIRKIWGGALSVDYDKFLNALGPEQELRFKAVLEERLSITV